MKRLNEWDLMNRIKSHGKSVDSPTGPVYVGCRCNRCARDRRNLSELRVKTLAEKWNEGLKKVGLSL